jgi:hypothetical protein
MILMRRRTMLTIDMRDGYDEVTAWYALALLVEAQGEEGEQIRERCDIEAAKVDQSMNTWILRLIETATKEAGHDHRV